MSSKNYIVFDLEATCWKTSEADYIQETIEIGAFRINEFGVVRGKFNRFVRPVIHPTLSRFCIDLTNIEQIDINRADTFPVVLDEFIDWARIGKEEHILCSWGSFDRKMLQSDCRLHKLNSDWVENHINLKAQYMSIKGSKKSIGLLKAIERENIIFTGWHHRGISDAENLTKLFLKYMDRWQF